MNILILGDSWAVELPSLKGEQHLVTILKKHGCNIYNAGVAGGSNIDSLNKARRFPNDVKFDWAVWFHTELSRDRSKINYKKLTIDNALNSLATIVYSEYQSFFSQLQCKIAVVGGCADLHKTFYDYISPDFYIPSWRKELIGIGVQCMNTACWIPDTADSIENKYMWINLHDAARVATDASEKFPDNSHPGTGPHTDLANRLLKIF